MVALAFTLEEFGFPDLGNYTIKFKSKFNIYTKT